MNTSSTILVKEAPIVIKYVFDETQILWDLFPHVLTVYLTSNDYPSIGGGGYLNLEGYLPGIISSLLSALSPLVSEGLNTDKNVVTPPPVDPDI